MICKRIVYCCYYNFYYFTLCESFPPTLPNGISLESEWQQVSKTVCILAVFWMISIRPLNFHSSGSLSKCVNYYQYHCYPHVLYLSQVPVSLRFLHLFSVIRWDVKIHYIAIFCFVFCFCLYFFLVCLFVFFFFFFFVLFFWFVSFCFLFFGGFVVLFFVLFFFVFLFFCLLFGFFWFFY